MTRAEHSDNRTALTRAGHPATTRAGHATGTRAGHPAPARAGHRTGHPAHRTVPGHAQQGRRTTPEPGNGDAR
ncbi:hypothetical protein GCM10010508_64950 [Streptomyces naganishii JCM 4654]|uniref:Uncharacterized protein n=1 Tax=Streptomyces naganishii JCM 4654 TaxID=1306179 RepID=A0A919D0F8_9ACTN|nr:hypothetical protein GCM10010508_64950 [Streptomyces naganishii JCM 4654]